MATKQLPWPRGRDGIPLKVVADPAIASSDLADGRFVPVAILDTSDRPDLAELIRLHTILGPGDVDVQWASSKDQPKVFLIAYFRRPAEVAAVIEFDVETQWALVDQILQVRSLYVQAGKSGATFLSMQDAPALTMEVPDLGFRNRWERIVVPILARRLRKEGISRWEAKRAARQVLEERRKLGQLRIR
jgi:hypothetical protein